MKPIKRILTIYQGATFTDSLVWKTGDPAVPVDFIGCTARMHVRQTAKAATTLLELTTENGRITLGPDGAINILINAVDTAAIAWATGVYDLEIVFSTGYVRRFMEGNIIVSGEETRP